MTTPQRTFKDLTVVSVTGSTEYIQGSIYAIQRSCDNLDGARGLLISPPLPENIELPSNIIHKIIKPFGYMEYNIFILYQLDYFIETDFCLLVQNDGWVLNKDNWRDEFWEYDYIGAPVPSYFIQQQNGFVIQTSEHYLNNLDLINEPNHIEPQNGGFSLRSKKLLGMPRKLGLSYLVTPPKPVNLSENEYKMSWGALIHNEDMFLSAFHRNKLIENGVKFAPSSTALLFSVESVLLHQARNVDIYNVFGCHFFGVIRLVGYNKVEVQIKGPLAYESQEKIKKIPNIEMFIRLGYDVHIILFR